VDQPQNPQPEAPQPAKKRRSSTNVPIPIVVGVICLGLGIAGGILFADYAHGRNKHSEDEDTAAAPTGKEGAPPVVGGKGGGGGGGGKKGGKGFGGGGGGAPQLPAKLQLAQLVTKLDVITGKPVELTPDQKTQMRELVAGLDTEESLSDDEAKKRLDALLKVVEGQKDALAAVGFRWPGSPPAFGGGGGMGPGGGMQPANPFKSGEPADRLKSLQATLGK